MEKFNFQQSETEVDSNELKLKEAKEQIGNLIQLMSSRLGIDISKEDYPEIEFSPGGLETSAYSSTRNIIYIHPDYNTSGSGLGSGITYGEEIGHFLRYKICQNKEDKDLENSSLQAAIDEFYGRIAENLARDVSVGTELDKLFTEDERSFFKNEDLDRKIKEDVAKLRPLVENAISITEKQFGSKLEVIKKIKGFYSALETAEDVCKKAKDRKKPPQQVLEEVLAIVENGDNGRMELIKTLNSLEEDGKYPVFATPLLNVIRQAKNGFQRLVRYVNDPDYVESIEIYDLFTSDLKYVRNCSDFELYNISSSHLDFLPIVLGMESKLYHIVGYAAAEHFFEKKADWLKTLPQVFHLTNEEALTTFLQNEEFQKWIENNEALSELYDLENRLEEFYEKVQLGPDEEV